jgi:nitroreductase
MDAKQAMLKRRSVRDFTSEPVSESQITDLLEAAMAAPSACNKKPWEFYVIKDKKTQDALKASSPHGNYNSPLLIIVMGNTDNSLSKDPNDFWIQDCSAAVENLLVEAASCGLGTCWCGIYPRLERVKAVKDILKLKDNLVPLALIHVGHPTKEPEARTQFEQGKVHVI